MRSIISYNMFCMLNISGVDIINDIVQYVLHVKSISLNLICYTYVCVQDISGQLRLTGEYQDITS